jgi:uncharacterized protein involved in response to NO
MHVLDRTTAMAIMPLLRLAFRPFFLLGCALALLAIPLWLAGWNGAIDDWQPAGGWLSWHRHELLFGFGLAIISGFLLTAVQNWTGHPGLSGKPLGALALLWIVGRLAWLSNVPWPLLAVVEVAFPLVVAVLMARTLWAARQARNYPIVMMLLLLAAMDGLSVFGLRPGDEAWQRQGVWGGLWLVAAMMAMIGGRVIPFFTQRGLGQAKAVAPWPWLDYLLLAGTALLALLYAAGPALSATTWIGLLFAALAAGHLLRLVRWHARGLWRVPLLWSLHVAYGWLVLACLGLALWHFGVALNPSLAVHCLTVGSMAGLILAMTARVSLGHTGRPLDLPAGMTLAFVLINLACFSRVVLVLFMPATALTLAGLCWFLAFAVYAWRYGPMLLRARVDNQPG